MARSISLLLTTLFLLSSCDVEQSPLVSANEMFDRGVSLYDDGSLDQAEIAFTQAIPVYENQKEGSRLSECYTYLGRINLRRGHFKNALETARIAFDQSRQANDFRGQARVHLLQGDILQLMGDGESALTEYESSFALSSAFDDRASKATAALKKGYALYCLDRWDDAIVQYDIALGVYRELGDKNALADALIGCGEVYHRQRRYGEALSSLNQAKDVLDDSDRPATAARLSIALGNVHRAMNDGNRALQEFRDGVNVLRSLRAAREQETVLLFSIGTLYAESGRWDDAKRFYNDAATVAKGTGDRLAENYNYLFIADATERQLANQPAFQLEKRVESYLQIAQRFQDCGHRTGEAYAYGRAGDLTRAAGRIAEARSLYQRAIDLEEQRYGEYLNRELHLPYQIELGIEEARRSWYRSVASVLLELRRPADALRAADRAQAGIMERSIREANLPIRNVVLQKDMATFREKLNEITILQLEYSSLLADKDNQIVPRVVQQIRSNVNRLSEEMKAISERVVRAFPNYGPLTREYAPGLGELQSLIPRGTLILVPHAGDRELTIFAVSRTGFEVKTANIGRERLLGLVGEYRRLLGDPNVYSGAAGEASLPAMTRFATLSTQLYELFLRPIDAMIDRNLLIVPGRDFENFPFHALERQNRDGTIQYVVEMTNVDYLTTLSSLRYRASPVTRIRDVLAVGDPTGRNWSIDYELRDIRSFFRDANVLIGFEATWKNLNRRSDILQLSTSFTNHPGAAPFGFLALSDGETYEESIDIPFEHLASIGAFPVVVLANTAGQGGGLTPAHAHLLRINGTSDVFFNAWGADRKAAKFFSEFFYTHLANGLAPGDAYRQALLNLIKTHEVSHPFSWAQFFHVGVG